MRPQASLISVMSSDTNKPKANRIRKLALAEIPMKKLAVATKLVSNTNS